MKIVQLRQVIEGAAKLHRDAGAVERSARLHDFAEALKDHDDKTVAAFVKAHKERKNRLRVQKGKIASR